MDELKNISPKLSKLKKENPFGVPNHYFDNFSARMHAKLEEEKRIVPKKQNKLILFLKPALGLAASFALIFMLVYWPLNNFTKKGETLASTVNNSEQEEFNLIVDGMDDNSFFALLEDENGNVEFSDEDLLAYVSANISDYEIYVETANN